MKKMRVLWFSNTPSCYEYATSNTKFKGYNGGGWISSAEKAVYNSGEIELAISFFLDGQSQKCVQHGVTYYPIPNRCVSVAEKVNDKMKMLLDGHRHSYEKATWRYYLEHFSRIINNFLPDIIHVWGSEEYFGLVSKVTEKPVILYIQGLINPCNDAFLPPFMSWNDFIGSSRTPIKMIRNRLIRIAWNNSSYREREIFKGIQICMGRTDWDRRLAYILNPQAKYFHVDEILRDVFYEEPKRIIPKKLNIVTTISQAPYKGFDMVLKTAKVLKEQMNKDFEWYCYGNIDPQIVENRIGIRHDDVDVRLMGVVTAEELREAEQKATLYFHSSYIDNSPNSLCEAQILGVPVVSTNVGGIPSLVDEGEDGFLIPSNDSYQAAYQISSIFQNPEMNCIMGEKARRKAMERHNPQRIIEQIMKVYSEFK